MTDYLLRPIYEDEEETYYAVPRGHPWLSEDQMKIEFRPFANNDENSDDGTLADIPDDFIDLGDDYDEACRLIALMSSLNEWEDIFTVVDDDRIECGHREWLVVTDERADELWDQDLESYIDECILPDLPAAYRDYFDREKWKSDAKFDGRAHSLNRYDGNEDSVDIEDGETYYIYRQN